METLESRVIDYIFKLLTQSVKYEAKPRVKLCRLFEESEFSLEKYIKQISFNKE
jgi:hypothetical protein